MQYLPSRSSLIPALAFSLCCFAAPAHAAPSEPLCSQPQSSGSSPVASDCLFILNVAVGLELCSPECVCAPKGSLPTSASDALICLNSAVGSSVELDCPCDTGEPVDPGALIGIVTATRTSRLLPPPPIVSVGAPPPPPSEETAIEAAFGILIAGPQGVESTTTTEEIEGCTVRTVEQVTDLDEFMPLQIMPLDPGEPGSVENGTVQTDLVADGAGGFVAASPDPLGLGFDGGQTITFSFPGGDDIEAFSDSVRMPANVSLISPDLGDPEFDIVPGAAIDMSWVAAPDQDGDITVTLSTMTTEMVVDGGSGTTGSIVNSVTVICGFSDVAGSATVPAAATEDLLSMAPAMGMLSKSFEVTREYLELVDVSAPGIEGAERIGMVGSTKVTRRIGAPSGPMPPP